MRKYEIGDKVWIPGTPQEKVTILAHHFTGYIWEYIYKYEPWEHSASEDWIIGLAKDEEFEAQLKDLIHDKSR